MAGPAKVSLKRTEEYASDAAKMLKDVHGMRHFTDFSISSNGERFPCHKVVLTINSPVMMSMLTSDMREASQEEVCLDHIKPSTLSIILDYMYGIGETSFHADNLLDLIAASDYLQMKILMKRCVDQVILTASNVINWLRLAGKFSLSDLQAQCLDLIFFQLHGDLPTK